MRQDLRRSKQVPYLQNMAILFCLFPNHPDLSPIEPKWTIVKICSAARKVSLTLMTSWKKQKKNVILLRKKNGQLTACNSVASEPERSSPVLILSQLNPLYTVANFRKRHSDHIYASVFRVVSFLRASYPETTEFTIHLSPQPIHLRAILIPSSHLRKESVTISF
jgi:hypothetical protein